MTPRPVSARAKRSVSASQERTAPLPTSRDLTRPVLALLALLTIAVVLALPRCRWRAAHEGGGLIG
ncbi:MAG: hypothetical protein Q605_AUC01113G0002, partial [Actinomyces urogenitalis DORA_12]